MRNHLMTTIVGFGVAVAIGLVLGCAKKKDEGRPPALGGNIKGKTTTDPNTQPEKKKTTTTPPAAQNAPINEYNGLWTSNCLTQFDGYQPHKMVLRLENGVGFWKVYYYNRNTCANDSFERVWTSDEFSAELKGDAGVEGFKKIDYSFEDGGVHYNIIGQFPGNPSKRLYEGNTTTAQNSDGDVTDGTTEALRPTTMDARVEYFHTALP